MATVAPVVRLTLTSSPSTNVGNGDIMSARAIIQRQNSVGDDLSISSGERNALGRKNSAFEGAATIDRAASRQASNNHLTVVNEAFLGGRHSKLSRASFRSYKSYLSTHSRLVRSFDLIHCRRTCVRSARASVMSS